MTIGESKGKGGAKKVPAVEKCFKILELLGSSKPPLGITDLSQGLGYHKSTVFNIIYTLINLGFLEKSAKHKVRLSSKFYVLSQNVGVEFTLISKIRAFLEELNRQTKLSIFLGLRHKGKAIIADKVDSTYDIKVFSEIGLRIPLTTSAGGQVLLSQLPEAQMDIILREELTSKIPSPTIFDMKRFKNKIITIRSERFLLDDEETLQGIRTLAIPLNLGRPDQQSVIWMMGLKSQVTTEKVPEFKTLLKKIGVQIEALFFPEERARLISKVD